MRTVSVSLDAQTDLLEIWTYLFERSESTAARIISDITSTYDALGENPGIGPLT